MSESRKKRHSSGLRSRPGNGETHPRGPHQARNKMNQNPSKGNNHRQQNYDQVRKIVQEEGRTARNLIAYSVPVEDEEDISRKQKSPRSPSRRGHQRSSSAPKMKTSSLREPTPPGRKISPHNVSLDTDDGSRSGSRPSSQSSMGPRKGDLRARYWAFLFDNLRRAVDEIYQTCEADESVVECKEVIMMLEQCTKDFKSLIQRLDLLKAFENAEEGQKPTSLAWELRKSSPGKSLSASQGKEHLNPGTGVVRNLNFGSAPPAQLQTKIGNSWADKVKGLAPINPSVPQHGTNSQSTVQESTTEPVLQESDSSHTLISSGISEEEDTDGWETVQRGSRAKRQNSASSHGSGKDVGHNIKNQNKGSHKQMTGGTSRQSHSNQRNSRGPRDHKKSTAVSHPMRNKKDSRDSEKENRPALTQQQNLNRNVVPETVKKQVPADETVPKPFRGWETIRPPASVAQPEKPTEKSEKSVTVEQPESNCKIVSDVPKPAVEPTDNIEDYLQEKQSDVGSTSDEDMRKEDDEDDAEEELATQLDHALESAMNEEDSLTTALEQEQEAALETAIAEEQTWLKELERESSMEILVDTEGEGDAADEQEGDGDLETSCSTLECSEPPVWDWDTMVKLYDESDSTGGSTWGELVEMEETDARTPGRVVHMHEKLSSPSRKRSPTESRKRHEEKQAKARELREKLLQEKADRLHELTKKVEEVRSWKEELLRQRRITMEHKMQRAEEKRQIQLKQKIKKAHEEETKANEIAFINTLEAQNKRHDIIAKHQESEARLHDLQEERQRKVEEKAAKEAAVEERRRALEAERLARLAEMQERRRQRETEIEQKQQERKKKKVPTATLR